MLTINWWIGLMKFAFSHSLRSTIQQRSLLARRNATIRRGKERGRFLDWGRSYTTLCRLWHKRKPPSCSTNKTKQNKTNSTIVFRCLFHPIWQFMRSFCFKVNFSTKLGTLLNKNHVQINFPFICKISFLNLLHVRLLEGLKKSLYSMYIDSLTPQRINWQLNNNIHIHYLTTG